MQPFNCTDNFRLYSLSISKPSNLDLHLSPSQSIKYTGRCDKQNRYKDINGIMLQLSENRSVGTVRRFFEFWKSHENCNQNNGLLLNQSELHVLPMDRHATIIIYSLTSTNTTNIAVSSNLGFNITVHNITEYMTPSKHILTIITLTQIHPAQNSIRNIMALFFQIKKTVWTSI